MKLNQLKDNQGARQSATRVGRGIGSGKGKTAGRGVKGQKSRSGASIRPGFEGGQRPLYLRLPMRGFTNPFRKEYTIINVGALQQLVDAGRLDAAKPVDMAALQAAGFTKKAAKDGLKVLGNGDLTAKLTITAAVASKSAQDKVAKAGGKLALTVKADA